jgi:hypothetical protein
MLKFVMEGYCGLASGPLILGWICLGPDPAGLRSEKSASALLLVLLILDTAAQAVLAATVPEIFSNSEYGDMIDDVGEVAMVEEKEREGVVGLSSV